LRRLRGALVTDYDRTLTDGELNVYPPALDALRELQEKKGTTVIIATGRGMPFVKAWGGILSFSDAVVAEDGAVIWLPKSARVEVLGDGSRTRAAFRAYGMPCDEGEVIVSVKKTAERRAREIVEREGLEVDFHYNFDSVMLLPRGVDKVAGVRAALGALHVQGHDLICIGDGENDLALFDMGTLKVATENAVEALKEKADIVCDRPYAEGVARFIDSLLEDGPVQAKPQESV